MQVFPKILLCNDVRTLINDLNLKLNYSSHLNTKHLKFDFLDTFCPVFKWSDHMIRWTIQIPNILDHHLKSGPFDNWTRMGHSNSRLVQYLHGYCMYTNVSGLNTSMQLVPQGTVISQSNFCLPKHRCLCFNNYQEALRGTTFPPNHRCLC